MKATTQLSTDPGHREEKKRKLQRTQRWSQVAKDHPVTGEMDHGCGPQASGESAIGWAAAECTCTVRGETVRKALLSCHFYPLCSCPTGTADPSRTPHQSCLHSTDDHTVHTSPRPPGTERPLGAPQPDPRTAIRIISVSSFPPRESDLLHSSCNPGFERRQTEFEENIGRVFSPSSLQALHVDRAAHSSASTHLHFDMSRHAL
jgi:hypothetical protein